MRVKVAEPSDVPIDAADTVMALVGDLVSAVMSQTWN
jgi:hypothetical protein